jgi:hypothetical protein
MVVAQDIVGISSSESRTSSKKSGMGMNGLYSQIDSHGQSPEDLPHLLELPPRHEQHHGLANFGRD